MEHKSNKVIAITVILVLIAITVLLVTKESQPVTVTTPEGQVELDEPIQLDDPTEEQTDIEEPSSESEEVVALDTEISNIEDIFNDW